MRTLNHDNREISSRKLYVERTPRQDLQLVRSDKEDYSARNFQEDTTITPLRNCSRSTVRDREIKHDDVVGIGIGDCYCDLKEQGIWIEQKVSLTFS